MTTNHKKSKSAEASDPDAVERYLKALAHPLKAEIEALRRIILKADARVTEGIKWNVPSFHAGEWFATFDFRSKEWIQLVFHRAINTSSLRLTLVLGGRSSSPSR